jgi:hypothetical protein
MPPGTSASSLHEGRCHLRVLFQPIRTRDDGAAVKVQPVLRVGPGHDVGLRNADADKIEIGGEKKARDRVHLPLGQHGIAQVGRHAGPGDLAGIDAGGLGEGREDHAAAFALRRA